MRIYLFTLKESEGPNSQWGVTARNENDAIALLQQAVKSIYLGDFDPGTILSVKELQSADELDQNHVVPNMGVIVRRGVWYPNLPYIQ
jgi:hypothetical protein